MELSPHSLTPIIRCNGIRSLVGDGTHKVIRLHSVLYPRTNIYEASPKAISRRTSYCQVRLAFHLYPQLIP
jgi:hypothetical protein